MSNDTGVGTGCKGFPANGDGKERVDGIVVNIASSRNRLDEMLQYSDPSPSD
jgi:hypothetical protein